MFLEKKDKKYSEFLKAGGGLSGVYDISDKKTLAFVRKYREFIPKREIYTDVYKRQIMNTTTPYKPRLSTNSTPCSHKRGFTPVSSAFCAPIMVIATAVTIVKMV